MSDEVPLQIDLMWRTRQATVSREIAEAAYEQYAHRYGDWQSFERLHERGGFEAVELMQLLVERIERLEQTIRDNSVL